MTDASEGRELRVEAGGVPELLRPADRAASERLGGVDDRLLYCEHDDDVAAKEAFAEAAASHLKGWETAKLDTRRYMIEAVGRENMKLHGAPTPHILPVQMAPNEHGAYTGDSEFTLRMNEELLEDPDPTKALEAYLHESRHAEQDYEQQRLGSPIGAARPRRSEALGVADADYTPAPTDWGDPHAEQQFRKYEANLLEFDARVEASVQTKRVMEHRGEIVQSGTLGHEVSAADRAALQRLKGAGQ